MPCTPADAPKIARVAAAVANNFSRALRKLWPWLAAVTSGLLYAACFSPFDQSWLCWIALTPLIAAAWFGRSTSTRPWLRNLLLGYVAGVVFFTTTFYWLGSLGELFGSVWLRGLPFLLSIYLGMHIAAWTWFAGLVRPKNFASSASNLIAAALIAAAWVTHEWVRGWLFGGFGWNGLGIALHRNWPLIQIAEFTGVGGISFLIAFANVIALTTPLRLFHEARSHRMRPHWDINLTFLAIVALFVFGWRSVQNTRPTKPLRVAAVQANIAQTEKMDRQSIAKIFDTYRRLSSIALRANPPPDLLVWPESATPGPAFGDEQSYDFVMEFATSSHADLLLGTDEIATDRAFNAAVLVSDGGKQAQIYHKIHLVPFGEYVPLRHSFPLFAVVASRWVPGDFNFGEDYTVFRLTNDRAAVAPLICFEDTIGELTRQFVNRGADLLVNVTNDGWFLHTAGSRQHLANSIFRCIETRRPMVRAANTGVTCFVNEFGRVTQILRDDTGNSFTEGVLTGDVSLPQDRQLTFYTRYGELFTQICAAVTAIAVLVVFVRRRFAR
jgi:apolipoprotein N-acyltransferase